MCVIFLTVECQSSFYNRLISYKMFNRSHKAFIQIKRSHEICCIYLLYMQFTSIVCMLDTCWFWFFSPSLYKVVIHQAFYSHSLIISFSPNNFHYLFSPNKFHYLSLITNIIHKCFFQIIFDYCTNLYFYVVFQIYVLMLSFNMFYLINKFYLLKKLIIFF